MLGCSSKQIDFCKLQSLGVEPVDEKILKAKPRSADDAIVTQALLLRAVTSAALIVFLTLKVFSNELDDGNVTRRDTTMTFMTFVNCDLFNAYVCRSAEKCFYQLSLFSNPAFLWAIGGSILGQLLVIYFRPLQEVFQTEALSAGDLIYIILLSSNILWLDTLRKKFFESWFNDGFHASPLSKKDHIPKPRTRRWFFQSRSGSTRALFSSRAGDDGDEHDALVSVELMDTSSSSFPSSYSPAPSFKVLTGQSEALNDYCKKL